jgi:hypothetical protein
MLTLAIGVVVLALGLWAVGKFAKADPKLVIRRLSQAGGAVSLAGAAGLAATGRFLAAAPLLFIGLSLLGWLPQSVPSWSGRTTRTAGRVSRVRTALVEMELDHDSGDIRGTVLAGAHEGVALAALDRASLIALLATADEESRSLLEAYLDRREPGWREDIEPDAAARPGRPAGRGGPMTEQEAYQILGLEPGASAADIRRAHRTLMKRLHPDQGGTDWLAARVNEAKDVLLRRHR